MKHIIKPLALLPFILLGCAYNNTYHKPDVPVKTSGQFQIVILNLVMKVIYRILRGGKGLMIHY